MFEFRLWIEISLLEMISAMRRSLRESHCSEKRTKPPPPLLLPLPDKHSGIRNNTSQMRKPHQMQGIDTYILLALPSRAGTDEETVTKKCLENLNTKEEKKKIQAFRCQRTCFLFDSKESIISCFFKGRNQSALSQKKSSIETIKI